MEIVKYGNPVLRRKSRLVKSGDLEVLELMDQMMDEMHSSDGIGLAAPQIGVLKRVVVIDIPLETERFIFKLINPKIVWASEEMVAGDEGCLSLPGIYEVIERPSSVSVECWDENYALCRIEQAVGLLAACLQHEIDHLDGKLFIDHLERGKKQSVLRRYRKEQKMLALAENANVARTNDLSGTGN